MNILKCLLKLTVILVIVSGCRGTEKTTDSESKNGGSGTGADANNPGTVDSSAGFNVTVQPDVNYTYKMHQGTGDATDDWSVPCKIEPTATGAARDITCIVEAHELDLYFFGIGLRFNVPPSMCNYVIQSVPYHYMYQPGTGNASVIDNRAGSVVNGGVAVGGVSPYLACPFDYSGTGGPNCCEGTYSLSVYTDDPAQPVDKVTVSTQKWGGKAANCLNGPAMTIAKGFTTNGYPMNTLFFIEGVGINIGYFLPSSISKGLNTNIFAANYFKAADHLGGTPLMTKAAGFPSTQREHEFLCLDRSKEISASIKVYVREWNTVSELVKGAVGDPDVTGAETSGIGSFNDYIDLKDLGEAYPGSGL